MRILIILRRLIIYNRRLTRLKKFVCMLCLLTGMAWLYVQPVQAQKKEIAAAKDLVKAGKTSTKYSRIWKNCCSILPTVPTVRYGLCSTMP